MSKLREEFPREAVPLVLAPLLYRSPTKTAVAATTATATGAKSNETDAEEETTTTTTTSSWSSSDADNLNEVGIEDIYDHLCEIIFTNQVSEHPSLFASLPFSLSVSLSVLKIILLCLQGKNNIMDTSWINLILEIGYEFTSSVEECKNHLCCGGASREIQPKDVAKIIGLMCRRHSSLLDCNVNLPTPANFWPGQGQQGGNTSSTGGAGSASQPQTAQQSANNNNDGSNETTTGGGASSDKKDKKETTDATQTWKPDVFVQALKELVPGLNWKDVCMGKCSLEILLKIN